MQLSGQKITSIKSKKHYYIQGLLGRGGSGTVYLTCDLGDWNCYALKISREEARLFREYGFLCHFAACNFSPMVYDWDYFDFGQQYWPGFVLQYQEGVNLRTLLQKKVVLTFRETLDLAEKTAEILCQIHEHGYIYGDLKLENLIYQEEQAKLSLIDYGSMQRAGERIEHFTPAYDRQSRGQGSRQADRQYDIFSFSVLLQNLLTGKKEHSLQSIIAKGLGQEYETMQELQRELQALENFY